MANHPDRAPRDEFEYMALCPAGFEGTLAEELRALGIRRVRPLRGNVSFFGDLEAGYTACLWSRLASRVLLVLDRVGCEDMDDLYECVMTVAWEDHIPQGATIAAECRGGNTRIRDLRFATLRVKDAVCDRLREVRDARPSVDTENPDVRVVVTVRERRATVMLDLGGGSLVDHGYRVPLRGRTASSQGRTSFVREDMAALMLTIAKWPKVCARNDRARLVDPLGSSAVLPVEAACVACDRAPHLTRRHWGFTGWSGHDAELWARLLAQAEARFKAGRAHGVRVTVACPDASLRAEAAEMARRAAVSDALEVCACSPAGLDLGEKPLSNPLVAAAMPDAGGTSVPGDLPARLAAMAALTRSAALAEAPAVVLTAGGDLVARTLGLEPEATCNVINGREDCSIVLFPSAAQAQRRAAAEGSAPAEPGLDADAIAAELPVEGAPAPAEPGASLLHQIELPGDKGTLGVLMASTYQFAMRLHKMAKLRGKWARRTGVSCYRVYDADLPDYAVAVDLYQGASATPGRWAVVSEYAAPREIDPAVAAKRLSDALAVVPRVLDVDPENVFLKVREKAKGGSQYADRAKQGRTALVEEGGLTFEVNFSDYLDTGLFLDHRLVRGMLREKADGARFLNLYAYTGTASCYAADGGAFETTTVDLSNTYLAWARRNMEQNGFGGRRNEFVQADVMPWIDEQRHTRNRWDLIYVDPPTFSNSARMRKRGFDVQDDHTELLIGASRLLTRGGTILFSCNLRGFKPDVERLAAAGVAIEDITPGTIPEDFERNAKVHHCYLVTRPEQ
jgi:23S rRNA (guanine2445-N2)-methyltransferase / 23S rRNA (guanine2069-N7)-methyltransferase